MWEEPILTGAHHSKDAENASNPEMYVAATARPIGELQDGRLIPIAEEEEGWTVHVGRYGERDCDLNARPAGDVSAACRVQEQAVLWLTMQGGDSLSIGEARMWHRAR